MRIKALKVSLLLVSGIGSLLAVRTATADSMFLAIGEKILEAPKAPGTTDPLVETTLLYQEAGLNVKGMVYAGDGLLYVCATTTMGSKIFRFDPMAPAAIETVTTAIPSPRCGSVDVDGSLVVASGNGGIWKIPQVAGMCLDGLAVDFCYPFGGGGFPSPVEITGNNSFGPAADVAYFYNSDFLTLVAGSSGNPGQGQGGGGSPGRLLRSIWPAYEAGFRTSGNCTTPPRKNTKVLLGNLAAPNAVTVSGGEIYLANGRDLLLVDIPDAPTGPFPACVSEPAATTLACESFGRLNAASLAGDVGGTVYVGSGSRNRDAVVYSVMGCSKTALLIFPRQDWATTISGLAVEPGTVTVWNPSGLADDPIELDGSHTYTLEATCTAGDSIVAGPATVGMVLDYIDSIPDTGDDNTPGFNDIIGSPSPFPGYDGFPWMWNSDCDVIDPVEANYERHIISSYQRQSNLRIGASESGCDPVGSPASCNSAYILLEFNVPFDPDLVPVDPIGGRRGGTLTYLAGAALEDTDLAEFCGYQSPLSPGFDLETEPVLVLTDLPTTLPVKFKLELEVPDGGICTSGQPIDNAVVMISVARIAAETPSPTCPDFAVIYPLVPNGAGFAGPPPLFDDPGQPSGNYHFNLAVSSAEYCDGLYLITATFLTDNAVEQQTFFRVDTP